MHQSIPAAPSPPPPGLLRGICPPCQSQGWGISKFFAARGPGICQTRGQTRAFNTHAVSFQHITTQRILLEKQAHLSRTGKNWRGLWRHVLDFMHAFLQCLSRQNYIAELGSYRRESTFFLVIESSSSWYYLIIWGCLFWWMKINGPKR